MLNISFSFFSFFGLSLHFFLNQQFGIWFSHMAFHRMEYVCNVPCAWCMVHGAQTSLCFCSQFYQYLVRSDRKTNHRHQFGWWYASSHTTYNICMFIATCQSLFDVCIWMNSNLNLVFFVHCQTSIFTLCFLCVGRFLTILPKTVSICWCFWSY